jgi:CheY-specific phosphatase CheX
MADNYRKYNMCLERSVKHIFTNLFNDPTIDEIFEKDRVAGGCTVLIEMDGTLKGALRIRLPHATIRSLTKKINPKLKGAKITEHIEDIAGEMGNLIAGTFANQLQFIDHTIRLFPPEFGDDLVGITTFYDNINMIFESKYGILAIDLFYKEK